MQHCQKVWKAKKVDDVIENESENVKSEKVQKWFRSEMKDDSR